MEHGKLNLIDSNPEIKNLSTRKTKRCGKCKQNKSLAEYSKCKPRKDGLSYCCRACVCEYGKDHYQRNKEKVRERYNKRYQEASEFFWKMRLRSVGNVGLAEEFSKLYYTNPHCFYCGVLVQPNEVHIDHKTPKSRDGSNELENLVVACVDCNHLKHTRTAEEFLMFLKTYTTRFFGNEAEAGSLDPGTVND